MARQMIKRGKHKETAENHGKMFKRGNRGETLIETLFALLVGSVSLMILATMISMSARLIHISEANAVIIYHSLGEAKVSPSFFSLNVTFFGLRPPCTKYSRTVV